MGKTKNKVLDFIKLIEKDVLVRNVSLPIFIDNFIESSYYNCERNFSLEFFDKQFCSFIKELKFLKDNLNTLEVFVGELENIEDVLISNYCHYVLDGKLNPDYFIDLLKGGGAIEIFKYLQQGNANNFDRVKLQPFFQEKLVDYVNLPNIKLRIKGEYIIGTKKAINVTNVETFPQQSGVFKQFLESLLVLAKENSSMVYIESVLNESLYAYLARHPKTKEITRSSSFTLSNN